eukprot:COSAG01_NODE_30770_length_609_cov_47.360784_1_plen_21_part_10
MIDYRNALFPLLVQSPKCTEQ